MKKTLPLILALVVVVQASAQLSNGLVVYYPLDGNTNDMGFNGLHAVNNNAVNTQNHNSVANKAMEFNGTNAYLQFPNNPTLKPNLPITLSFWVKKNTTAAVFSQLIWSDFEYDNYSGYVVSIDNNNKVTASIGSNLGTGYAGPSARRTKTSNTGIQNNTWTHVVVVIRNGTDMSLYVNCVDAGGTYSGSGSTTIQYANSAGRIASSPGTTYGQETYAAVSLDEIAIWNRELTSMEIAQLCGDPLFLKEHMKELNVIKSVYPNPASNSAFIDFRNENNEVQIIVISNHLGQEVRRIQNTSASTVEIKRENLPAGIYFIELLGQDKKLGTTKLIFD